MCSALSTPYIDRDYYEALREWNARSDLSESDKSDAEFLKGFGIRRTPALLARLSDGRLFILDRFAHQTQIFPRTRETIERSYVLVGESSLSPNPAGQRYEFFDETANRDIFIDIYKPGPRALRVQILKP